jgi:hypothetical protein
MEPLRIGATVCTHRIQTTQSQLVAAKSQQVPQSVVAVA